LFACYTSAGAATRSGQDRQKLYRLLNDAQAFKDNKLACRNFPDRSIHDIVHHSGLETVKRETCNRHSDKRITEDENMGHHIFRMGQRFAFAETVRDTLSNLLPSCVFDVRKSSDGHGYHAGILQQFGSSSCHEESVS
jgi:hypothetical protein